MQESTELVSKMKNRFLTNLFSEGSKYNSVLMTKRKYDSIIEDVKRIKVSKKKESSRDYRIIQRYDVLTVQGCEKLIKPLSDARERVKKFVHAEELFDILYSTHLSIGHGGRDRMIKQLNTLYKNITQAQIKMFLDLCEPCQQKQKSAKKRIDVKPIISSHFNSRCQVDLIDYQSQPDGKFKFLLVYQDHLTKFVVLKPLSSKWAAEVAYNLLDIFLLFGAPSILHSNNGREFCNKIIECVTQLWPEIKIVNGKPRQIQIQGNVERGSQDIESMLTTWMADNQTNKWSEGVGFVQFMRNRAYHSEIKRSPYEAMFGCPAKVGLSSLIPQSVLHSINSEEDLKKLEDSQETGIMGSQSNLTQEDIPLSPASTESHIKIQEFINSNLKVPSTPLIEDTVMKNIQLSCTSNEFPLHVEEVITELPSTSAESPSQFLIEPVKRTLQDMVCIVCSKSASGARKCKSCDMFVHVICGEMHPNEKGYDKNALCNICKKNMDQKVQRNEAKKDLEKQVKKVLAVSNEKHRNVYEGVTVRIKVPAVDRAKTDARSLLAVVLSKTENGFYKLGTKKGILKQLYAKSEFSVCKERFLKKEDVPSVEISLLQTAIKQSLGNGPSFRKCMDHK